MANDKAYRNSAFRSNNCIYGNSITICYHSLDGFTTAGSLFNSVTVTAIVIGASLREGEHINIILIVQSTFFRRIRQGIICLCVNNLTCGERLLVIEGLIDYIVISSF